MTSAIETENKKEKKKERLQSLVHETLSNVHLEEKEQGME